MPVSYPSRSRRNHPAPKTSATRRPECCLGTSRPEGATRCDTIRKLHSFISTSRKLYHSCTTPYAWHAPVTTPSNTRKRVLSLSHARARGGGGGGDMPYDRSMEPVHARDRQTREARPPYTPRDYPRIMFTSRATTLATSDPDGTSLQHVVPDRGIPQGPQPHEPFLAPTPWR